MSGKQNSITVVHNFGGKRQIGEPSQFPWMFEMNEKAYIIKGSATLTADDE